MLGGSTGHAWLNFFGSIIYVFLIGRLLYLFTSKVFNFILRICFLQQFLKGKLGLSIWSSRTQNLKEAAHSLLLTPRWKKWKQWDWPGNASKLEKKKNKIKKVNEQNMCFQSNKTPKSAPLSYQTIWNIFQEIFSL